MRTNRTWKFILTDGELDAVFPLQLFSTPCDLSKSSQITTMGSSHLSSWCFPNPLFKKKSRYPAGLDLARAFQLPAKTLPRCVLLLLEEDTFVWLQEMKGSKTSTDQCREELLFFKKETWSWVWISPWMPKVFFKSSLLQCYITVCGKHRAAVKETQQRRLLQHEASASWILHISIPYFFSSFAFRNKRTFYTSGNDLYLRLTVSKSHESTKTNRK